MTARRSSRSVHLLIGPGVFLALIAAPFPEVAYPLRASIGLLGANMRATLWTRWELDRRIALLSLLGMGTGMRQQILTRFVVATVLSTLLPNTVVAAAMMPIVAAMLKFLDIEDIGKSPLRY